MKRSPIRRSSTPIKRSPIKHKKRKPSEFARIYGSKERVKFVKSLPCFGCAGGPSENHHIINGGMGRKSDYTNIIPLCSECHRRLHGVTRRMIPNTWLVAVAKDVEARWQAFSGKPHAR